MASANNFIIRCKTEDGSFIIDNISNDCTVEELKLHVSKKTNLSPASIKILCGYPPKAIKDEISKKRLIDVNICSGETIIVEKKESVKCDEKNSQNAEDKSEVKIAYDKKPESAIGERSHDYNEMLGGFAGIMMRHAVPSNNSCLFASVYFVLSNGDLNQEKSADLRKVIARVVSSNPEKYNAAFLGMSNKEYCAWIQNCDHWGGAIELSILSEHFGIEIVAVDTLSLKMHRFGENSNYNNRIFLIYDGIHYDPLILEMDNAAMQTIFPVNDNLPMEMAMEIAREAKSSRQYTDVANFTLRCMDCDEKLRGDKEAREHAVETGHIQFGEITK